MKEVSGSCPFSGWLSGGDSVSIEVEKGGFQGVAHWADVFARWLFSTSPYGNGGVGFFTDIVYNKKTGKPRDYVKISLVHKLSCGGLVHPYFWQVFNRCKGKDQLGGEELDKVAHVITPETPLTKNDNYEQQRALKKLCSRNHFSRKMVSDGFADIYSTIAESVEQSKRMSESSGSYNVSEMIIQLLSRANSVDMFGPHGSRSYEAIQDLIHDPKWDKVAKSVEIVGKHLNEAVLFSPKYYATKGKEGLVKLVKLSGLVNDSRLPKSEYQKHLRMLEKATTWIREASVKGIQSGKPAGLDENGNEIKGIIELMYESRTTFDDPRILKVIESILASDAELDPDVIVRALILSPGWQRKIKRAMKSFSRADSKGEETALPTRELQAFIDDLKKQASNEAPPLSDRLKPEYTYEKGRLTRVEFSTWSDEQIIGMIRLILVVGQRTTAFTLEAAIRCLILHPKWQEKIYRELKEKCPDGNLNPEVIKDLEMFHLFITEVYRLYPAVLIQTRETTEDMEVLVEYRKGKLASVKLLSYETPQHNFLKKCLLTISHVALYILSSISEFFLGSRRREILSTFSGKKILRFPKGTTMAYIHLLAQRHPDIFKDYDPHKFKPKRFVQTSGSSDENRKSLYVRNFSGSPSNCCGEWLAKEGTIPSSLLYLISNFVIRARDIEKVRDMSIVGGAIATHNHQLENITLTPR